MKLTTRRIVFKVLVSTQFFADWQMVTKLTLSVIQYLNPHFLSKKKKQNQNKNQAH